MAILLIDSFKQSQLAIPNKWAVAYPVSYITDSEYIRRDNTVSYLINNISSSILTSNSLGNSSTLIARFAIYPAILSATPSTILSFYDDAVKQCYLQLDENGIFKVYNGSGTLLGTALTTLKSNRWSYIELRVVFNTVAGIIKLSVNSTPYIFGMSLRTIHNSSSSNHANIVEFGTNVTGANIYISDLEIRDGTGTNYSEEGDSRVDLLYPVGAGAASQWTPSTGLNYQCVDELPANVSDYNSTETLDYIDSFIMSDLPTLNPPLGNINGVQGTVTAKYGASGSSSIGIKITLRLNNVIYYSPIFALTSSYACYKYVWDLNPETGSMWNKAELDGAEFGYVISSVS